MNVLFAFLDKPAMRLPGKIQLGLALAIYFYLAWSNAPAQMHFHYPDWLAHFLGNACLFGSFWLAFFYRRPAMYLLVLLIPFSIAVELGQHFNPLRSVSTSDLAANLAGLLLSFSIGRYLERFIRPKVNTA